MFECGSLLRKRIQQVEEEKIEISLVKDLQICTI